MRPVAETGRNSGQEVGNHQLFRKKQRRSSVKETIKYWKCLQFAYFVKQVWFATLVLYLNFVPSYAQFFGVSPVVTLLPAWRRRGFLKIIGTSSKQLLPNLVNKIKTTTWKLRQVRQVHDRVVGDLCVVYLCNLWQSRTWTRFQGNCDKPSRDFLAGQDGFK